MWQGRLATHPAQGHVIIRKARPGRVAVSINWPRNTQRSTALTLRIALGMLILQHNQITTAKLMVKTPGIIIPMIRIERVVKIEYDALPQLPQAYLRCKG